jgi:hypothetical protein
MTDREKELVKNYPEADAFAGAAASVWNGSTSPVKIEMVVITPDDFALIPFVLNEFDKVEHDLTDKMGFKKLLFQKNCEGLIYLAAVERGEYKMEVRTFWKMRVPGASC